MRAIVAPTYAWGLRIRASASTAFVILELLSRLGCGMEQLLWNLNFHFEEVLTADAFDFERWDEENEKWYEAPQTYERGSSPAPEVVFVHDCSPLVIAHEIGATLDRALDSYPAKLLHNRPRARIIGQSILVRNHRLGAAFAAYIDAAPPYITRAHLRLIDRPALALLRSIFRNANGAQFERSARP